MYSERIFLWPLHFIVAFYALAGLQILHSLQHRRFSLVPFYYDTPKRMSPLMFRLEDSPFCFSPCQRRHQLHWKTILLKSFSTPFSIPAFAFEGHRQQIYSWKFLCTLRQPELDPRRFPKQVQSSEQCINAAKDIADRRTTRTWHTFRDSVIQHSAS